MVLLRVYFHGSTLPAQILAVIIGFALERLKSGHVGARWTSSLKDALGHST